MYHLEIKSGMIILRKRSILLLNIHKTAVYSSTLEKLAAKLLVPLVKTQTHTPEYLQSIMK